MSAGQDLQPLRLHARPGEPHQPRRRGCCSYRMDQSYRQPNGMILDRAGRRQIACGPAGCGADEGEPCREPMSLASAVSAQQDEPCVLQDLRCRCGSLLLRALRGAWQVAETAPPAPQPALQDKCRRCQRILFVTPLSPSTKRPEPDGTAPMPPGGMGDRRTER